MSKLLTFAAEETGHESLGFENKHFGKKQNWKFSVMES